MADRIDYNSDGKTLDEVVISHAYVHLEQLNDSLFMLIIENKDTHLNLQIGSRSGKAKVDTWIYEGNIKKLVRKNYKSTDRIRR